MEIERDSCGTLETAHVERDSCFRNMLHIRSFSKARSFENPDCRISCLESDICGRLIPCANLLFVYYKRRIVCIDILPDYQKLEIDSSNRTRNRLDGYESPTRVTFYSQAHMSHALFSYE